MSAADRHPGDRLAALADGRLSSAETARVVAHLGRCAPCRNDYEAQLAMKGLLAGLAAEPSPGAPPDLRARLSDLSRPAGPMAAAVDRGRRPSLPPRRRRRTGRPPRSARRRRARAGASLLSVTAIVLAGGYALGGAPEGAAVTPPVDRYAREYAAISGGLPLTDPVLWALSSQGWPNGQPSPRPARPVQQSVHLRSAKVGP